MKLNIKLISISFFISTLILHGQNDVEFKAGAPRKVQVGDEFFLSFKINRMVKDIKIENSFTDFKVKYGPGVSKSYSNSFSNGVKSINEQTTFSFYLVALKSGFFTLPYASIIIDSIKYCSESIPIFVEERNISSIEEKDSGKFFAKLYLSADTIFKQEPIIAQLKLYSNMPITSIENVQIPQNENFLFYDLSIPDKSQMETDTFNNDTLKSILLSKFILIPTKTGDFNIDRIKINCEVTTTDPMKSNAFDNFSKWYQTGTISINTDSTSIHVKDFQGKIPNDFTYISGNDLKISASLDKPIIKKNEPFKYSITISGVGNLKLLSIPKIQFPQNIKVLKSEYNNNLNTDSLGIYGERVFSYNLYSDSIGKFEIPSISISYFDLGDCGIRQIFSLTLPLEVENTDLIKSNPMLNAVIKDEKYNKTDSEFASFILMDLSESMHAQDLQPNRKTAVIKVIKDYILETNQSTGIIVYSLIPELISPISMNKKNIAESLKNIDSLELGNGTSTGMAICMALDKLQKNNAKYKNIILFTDGENNKGAINEKMAIEFARQLNIPVNIIGIGAKVEFVPITINIKFGEFQQTVPVLIDDNKMNELSDQTGGKYYRVVDNETLKYAINDIDKNKKKKIKIESTCNNYTEHEIQSMINLMYQDILKEKESLKMK